MVICEPHIINFQATNYQCRGIEINTAKYNPGKALSNQSAT